MTTTRTFALDSPAGRQPVAAPPPARPIGKGWDRPQVTVKLTPRRKSLLCDIALGMPNGTTPSDAIERALEAAWASRQEIAALEARIDSLEDTIEAADGERRREADRTLAALAEMGASVARLHALIAAVASAA